MFAPIKRDGRLYRDEQAVDEYIAKWKERPSGAFLMISDPKKVRPQSRPALHRFSNSELQDPARARPASPPIDYLDTE